MRKRPGLIRWNFIPYLVVIGGLGAAYLFLGLDGHVKSLLEQKLGSLNGAPVHIEKALFKLSGPRIELEHLDFKDPTHPERTQFAIDKVSLALEWQALLRNRLVISESFASGVKLSPLQPMTAPFAESQSLIPTPIAHSLVAASDFLSNPERAQLPPEEAWAAVPSVQASKGLQSELTTQVAAWKKSFDAAAEESHQQIEALKAAQGKETDAQIKVILGQLERSRVQFTQLEGQVKADGNVLLSKVQTLSELIPHDVTVIKQGIKLPNLEFNQIGSELGSIQTASLIGIVDNFHYRLIPWLEKKEQALRNAYGRTQGTDFYFSGRLLPPRLWVKKLEMSSKADAASGAGDVIARISDLSSEPSVQPATMSLQAAFPKAEVANVQLEAQIDHRNQTIDDKLQLTVASFPVRDLDFIKVNSLRVGVEQASANLSLEYVSQGETGRLTIHSAMDKVNYRVESPSESVKKIFDEALAPLRTLDLDASAQGKFSGLHWTYASNLSDRLRTSLQQVMGQEYAEFYARIRERADQKVREEKRGLETTLVSESDAVQQRIATERALLSAAMGK